MDTKGTAKAQMHNKGTNAQQMHKRHNDIVEGGPPEGILSRFNDMFKEKEEATHLRAAEVMRELGWDATD